jgi:uncharacterized protein (TIGR00730 family)
MDNIAVFCGSKNGGHPQYVDTTNALGKALGELGKHIIYGGGNAGLMGAIANSCLENGGTVTGIIPAFLNSIERQHEHLTTLIVTETMHERKQLLFEKSDVAIILPGGYGSMDELFELLTWNQLALHRIKVIIFNINGFYNHLQSHINIMLEEGFLYSQPEENYLFFANTIDEVVTMLY